MSRRAALRRFGGNFNCNQLRVSGLRLRNEAIPAFASSRLAICDALQRQYSGIAWRYARRCLDFHEGALKGLDQQF